MPICNYSTNIDAE